MRAGSFIALSLLCCFNVVLCKSIPKLRKETAGPVIVKAMEVRTSSDIVSNVYVGTAEASKDATVLAGTSGTLVELNAVQGRRVSAGEVLARIESQTVRSTYDLAASTLTQAQDGYDRVSRLHKEGGVADIKMVEVETALAKAKATMAAAENALERCTVKAPISGVVTEVPAQRGEEVNIATVVAQIVDVASVEIHFPLPENEFKDVKTGDRASVYIPALDITTEAVVKNKGVVASRLSHSYDCVLGGIRNSTSLMPGMVCKVTMNRKGSESLVIPANCVMTDTEGRYVWTVEGNVVGKKHISVDGYSGNGIIVGSGLSEGDKVIIEGSHKVSTGMTVEVQY